MQLNVLAYSYKSYNIHIYVHTSQPLEGQKTKSFPISSFFTTPNHAAIPPPFPPSHVQVSTFNYQTAKSKVINLKICMYIFIYYTNLDNQFSQGYVWIMISGMEWDKIEQNEVEWYGTKLIFYCLNIFMMP